MVSQGRQFVRPQHQSPIHGSDRPQSWIIVVPALSANLRRGLRWRSANSLSTRCNVFFRTLLGVCGTYITVSVICCCSVLLGSVCLSSGTGLPAAVSSCVTLNLVFSLFNLVLSLLNRLTSALVGRRWYGFDFTARHSLPPLLRLAVSNQVTALNSFSLRDSSRSLADLWTLAVPAISLATFR